MFNFEKKESTEFRDGEGYDVVGGRCSLDTCRALDFLPTICSYCGGSFCAAHADPRAHECKSVPDDRGVLAVPCPVCGETVRWMDIESTEAEALEAHKAVCKPKEDAAKERCPVEGCKTVLKLTNSTVCGRCRLRVCMAHRFEDDHFCGRTRARWLNQVCSSASAPSTASGNAPGRPAGGAPGNASLGVKATAKPEVSAAAAAAMARAAGGAAGAPAPSAATTASAARPSAAAAAASAAAAVQRVATLRRALGGTAEAQEACLHTLQRLLENVVADPANPKFRTLKRDNKAIRAKILDVPGGEELLKGLGFEAHEETFELPASINKARVGEFLHTLVA